MGDKLNVYNLGQQGINRVRSPVHKRDGELLSAQNAIINPIGGLYGLAKRPGVDRLTGTSAGGAILAITNIPFVDPLPPAPPETRALYVHRTDAGALSALSASEDGSIWQDATLSPGGTLAENVGKIADQVAGALGFVTNLKTRYWDGVADVDILDNASANRLVVAHATYIYFSWDQPADRDIYYWTAASPGDYPYLDWPGWDEPSRLVSALNFLNDDVFVGSYDTFAEAGDGQIHRWDGAAWTLEASWPIAGGSRSAPYLFAEHAGALYAVVGTDDGTGSSADDAVWIRSGAGTWSALAAQITAQNANHYAAISYLIDIDGTLFALVNEHYNDGVPADDTAYIYRYEGGAWIEELAALDVIGDVDPPEFGFRQDLFWRAVSFGGDLWVTVHAYDGDTIGRLLRRAPNGVWSDMTPAGWNISFFLAAF